MAHSYRATAALSCSADDAWAVLVDFESYPEWNRFTRRVRAELTVGTWVRMTVVLGWLVIVQYERITEIVPGRRLCWSLPGPRWLLYAERVQTLTPTDEGCVYETVDTIEGVLAPLVELLFGNALRTGFEAVATGLKERTRCG